MEEAWNFEQKKNFILEMLYNEAGSVGRNQIWFVPRTVTGGESEYDPTFLYKKEYGHILEILEFENLLRVLDRDSEKGFHVELLERANKQTSWYVQDGYKTIGDVLLNAELRESLLKIILRAYGISDARELDRKRSIKTAIDERRDGLLCLWSWVNQSRPFRIAINTSNLTLYNHSPKQLPLLCVCQKEQRERRSPSSIYRRPS